MMDLTNPNTIPLYTLSTASALSGIPVHSIRQYIDRSLIVPFRKKSNRNLFSQVDILRLKFIHRLLVEDGLNIAGIKSLLALIPCWKIRKCSARDRKSCKAYLSNTFPCWESSDKGTACRNSDCRECKVYRIVEIYPDLKSFFRIMVP
jgi:MerR family transcriptional regulator/heat shock protein HspR